MRRATAPAEAGKVHRLQEQVLQPVAGYWVAKADLRLREIFHRHAGAVFGLRPVEYSALALVGANPGASPSRLARELALTAPHMTAVVNALEEKGWLRRSSSAEDRRSQHLHLTPDGAALVREATARIVAGETAELSLSSAERAMLVELLQKAALSRRPRG